MNSNKQTKSPRLVSLRKRFKVSAALIMLVVLIGSYIGYHNLSTTRELVSQNIKDRKVLLETTQRIRAELLNAYKSLDLFSYENKTMRLIFLRNQVSLDFKS